MLLYLDNHLSVGPHSHAATRIARRRERKIGINENLGREILELHTLGVGGGYTQTDVTTFAEVITGWSLGGAVAGFRLGEPGSSCFVAELHEPGTKVVLKRRYADERLRQGVRCSRSGSDPAAAHHIATKLARHFVADEPPPAAVERLARAFTRAAAICRRCTARSSIRARLDRAVREVQDADRIT